jgi:nucleotide-binding universal stress UspA family protein
VGSSPRDGSVLSGSPRRVLVAVTESPQTERLLRLAEAIAEPTDAAVWAIHVLPGNDGDGNGWTKDRRNRLHRLEAAEKWLARRLRDISGLAERTRIIVVIGMPSQEIISTARSLDADLIVMAAGRNRRNSSRMGPVTARVTSAAPCSVLVARG